MLKKKVFSIRYLQHKKKKALTQDLESFLRTQTLGVESLCDEEYVD